MNFIKTHMCVCKIAVSIILCFLVIIGIIFFCISGSEDKNESDSPFPTNTNGLTYGSAMEAKSDDEVPDLVKVMGKHGNIGYIYKDDYLRNTVSDYERYSKALSKIDLENAREQHKNEYDDISTVDFYELCYDIPVYDNTGENEIDKFTMSMGFYPYE